MSGMTPEVAAKLREPFPAEVIGKLPRVTCKPCSKGQCQQHQRAKCRVCQAYVSTQHIHLDFVGHANVTDRLLTVDPEWSWEPAALDADGLPKFDRHGGLWIRLTVAGVTRMGYGDAQGKEGGDGVKEAIGDALRNAAMRFGVALVLWTKTALEDHSDEPANGAQRPAKGQEQADPAELADYPRTAPKAPSVDHARVAAADLAKAQLRKSCSENGWDMAIVAGRYAAWHATSLKESTDAEAIEAFRQSLFAVPAEQLKAAS